MRIRRSAAVRLVASLALLLLVGINSADAVVITEIMYHPASAGSDAQSLEYIELYNESPDPEDLTGFFFTGGIRFAFTERTLINARSYLVVCADADRVKEVYGISNVIGNWDPETALDNGGEAIELVTQAGVRAARVNFNDRGRWPGAADGTGHSLEIVHIHGDQNDADNWVASAKMGGSPGEPNPPPSEDPVVFLNELFVFAPEGERWVEIFNPGSEPMDLSQFRITVNRRNLLGAEVPRGTSVPAGGWISFTDAELGLSFEPDLEERVFVALIRPDLSQVVDARTFRLDVEGFSESRIPDGSRGFSRTAVPTRDATNYVEVNQDVVINELLYQTTDRDPRGEFVELYNRGSEVADVSGWRLSDGIRFDFPINTVILPGDYLVVARDPEHIRSVYGLPAGKVIGPQDQEALDRFGVLADRGERITLEDVLGNTVDTVRYYDGGEWPEWADGGGPSLELIDPNSDNSAAGAWDASDDSDKTQVTQIEYTGTFSSGEPELHLVLAGEGITVVDKVKITTRENQPEIDEELFGFESAWRYRKGTTAPPEDWREIDFNDRTWQIGGGPIGYGERDEATLLDDMRGNYISVYFRKKFTIEDPAAINGLVLEIEFDDGFIAYLNGRQIAVVNMNPEAATFEDRATGSRDKARHLQDISEFINNTLVPGENVLAVQVHNSTPTSTDFRFMGALHRGRIVEVDGPNLLSDGDFESEDLRRNWTIQGTHVRSGYTSENPLDGSGSLKIVSSGNGDNKMNRIETSNAGLSGLQPRNVYHVSMLARWVVGTPTLLTHGAYNGSSSPSLAASHQLNYPPNPGTPGAVNSVTRRLIDATGASNVGPIISAVTQDPAQPGNDPVLVQAHVRDPDGVAAVELHYSANNPRPLGDPGLNTVPMTDPDGDGVYSGTIPPQSLRTTVVFFITAKDQGDRASRYPRDVLASTHPLVRDLAQATVQDERYLIYRAESRASLAKDSYRVWMTQQSEQYLNAAPLLSNDTVDASFVFNNEDMYYNAKVRFSGSPFARQKWNESWRVRMPDDKPLHDRYRKFGLEDHQGSGARDGRERISSYIMRYMQGSTPVPHLTQWLVTYQVNSRVVNQTREHVNYPNRQFINLWYPDDNEGLLFEMDDRHVISDSGGRSHSQDGRLVYPPYGSAARGADKEEYRYYFNPRMANRLDDFQPLVDLAKLMTQSQTPHEEFDARVFDEMDVEEFLRMWSVRLNTDDWDTWGARRGKNCYLYRPAEDGRWVLLPWDMELTYGNTGAFRMQTLTATSNPNYGSSFQEVTRFLNRPRIKRLWYGILQEMAFGVFSSDFLAPYMQLLQRAGVQRTDLGLPGRWIDQRRNQIRAATSRVTAQFVPFEITTNGGSPIVTESSEVVIDGLAPVEVVHLIPHIDDEPIEDFAFEYPGPSVVQWRLRLELPQGHYFVSFAGFDSQGNFIDLIGVDVTVGDPVPLFVRGDVDLSGRLTVSDAIINLLHLFDGRAIPCEDAADADDSGTLNTTDAIHTLAYLFTRGPAPAPPYPRRGDDPTGDDALGCAQGLE